MPANRFNGFTDYGIGIGLRIPHYQHILEKKPVVGWFEIISENYMVDGGRPLAILDQILEQYRVVQHGVSMYFGSAEPLNREHLRRLKALVKRTKTPWLTDHLCWGSVDGRYTHDLLPMPYTFEAAKVTARKIREARDLSGSAHRRRKRQQLRRVPRIGNDRMGVSQRSGGARRLRHSAGRQQHLRLVAQSQLRSLRISEQRARRSAWRRSTSPATPSSQKYILDTHDHPVIDPVWKLYEHAIRRVGPTATLLEWDDRIPSFDEVHAEARKAEKYIAAPHAVPMPVAP